MLLFGLLRASETKKGLAASFGGGHALAEILFGGKLQVSRHFRVEIAVILRAPEERAQATERLAETICHL
jgi:hypothetical protein